MHSSEHKQVTCLKSPFQKQCATLNKMKAKIMECLFSVINEAINGHLEPSLCKVEDMMSNPDLIQNY